ncbi:MAG: SAM-dependent chlorinase/fluorinase [Deltaproteobacteria bacterium]|nr:SAM-dependent chlorinase/fluorinase [Deltaproteobacteria bacterium]
MTSSQQKTITLLSDFGTNNHYVGAMKGVILNICPHAQIIDITHGIPHFQIKQAGFELACCYDDFPTGTIHVAVVDPGVGSSRKGLLIKTKHHNFIGPDNGLFDLILQREHDAEIFELDPEKIHTPKNSHTFHGRDLFSPAAAFLAKGVSPENIGKKISFTAKSKPKRTDFPLEGEVIRIDHFGNCITDIHKSELGENAFSQKWQLNIAQKTFHKIAAYYSESEHGSETALIGSSGFLEFSINQGNFSKHNHISEGCPVHVEKQK